MGGSNPEVDGPTKVEGKDKSSRVQRLRGVTRAEGRD